MEKKRCNSLPSSPGVHSVSDISDFSDDLFDITSDSVYGSDSCLTSAAVATNSGVFDGDVSGGDSGCSWSPSAPSPTALQRTITVGGGSGGSGSGGVTTSECAMNDLALSCLSRKQKFREMMTSWSLMTSHTATPSFLFSGVTAATTSAPTQPLYLDQVQRVRSVWEDRLLKMAANEAKRRDER